MKIKWTDYGDPNMKENFLVETKEYEGEIISSHYDDRAREHCFIVACTDNIFRKCSMGGARIIKEENANR